MNWQMRLAFILYLHSQEDVMQLERMGHWSKRCSASTKNFAIRPNAIQPHLPYVSFDFKEFGLGIDRFSAFRVRIGFDEVKAMLAAFADQGHQEADRMMADLKLAAEVRALVNPPTVDETVVETV